MNDPAFPCLIALPGLWPMISQPNLAMNIPFLALEFSSAHLIPIVAIVGGIGLAAIIIVAGILSHTKKNQLWHDTARLALEKGQPVPPMPRSDEELEHTPPSGVSLAEWESVRIAREKQENVKAGLILIAVGIGLYVMLRGQGLYVGAIPGFIGVALLLHALWLKPVALPRDNRSDRPPQA